MVRHHRERAGLTQGEVAEKINKALETVSSIERGKSAPSFETLSDLSDALGVPVREFFGAGAYDAKAGRNDPLVRLIDRVAGLGDDDIDWVDRLVTTALARKSRT
jgi:transcriptional regulator with XRE-family HTH domain